MCTNISNMTGVICEAVYSYHAEESEISPVSEYGPICSLCSYFDFLTRLDSSVTGESLVDETRVWRKYQIYSWYPWWVCLQPLGHWGVILSRGYQQPSSQHFCIDMHFYLYGHIYKLTVYKTFDFFFNTKAFLS